MVDNCYEVLGLAGAASSYTAHDIKTAYRKALLMHHPDKTVDRDAMPQRTIDAITNAYKTLTDPQQRAEHDRELTLQARQKRLNAEGHTGLETVDLDDLEPVPGRSEEAGEAWAKKCRCGRTYLVTEDQLEQEADKGELYIPCDGCSLWLQVLFQAADET